MSLHHKNRNTAKKKNKKDPGSFNNSVNNVINVKSNLIKKNKAANSNMFVENYYINLELDNQNLELIDFKKKIINLITNILF